MSRPVVLSNSELCVTLDERAMVRDIYYPHVGQEDHVRGHYLHRVGVWVDGHLSWLSEDPAWEITISCEEESLSSAIIARHTALGVVLTFKDIVYNEKPIFVRRVTVLNQSDRTREIKLYFGHQFEIYKSHGGDTAYFDPMSHVIVHYKGRRVFLIGALLDQERLSDYAIGLANLEGHEGTHKDAEDGVLSQNPIEHGPADSVIGLYAGYTPGQSRTCYYWICAATSIPAAHELNQYIRRKTPEHLLRTATDFWKAWVNAYQWNFYQLPPEHIRLFKHSLMYIRAQVDHDGGIVASVDSDMLKHGIDTYAYVWPRDAAFTALSLDRARDWNISKRFFEFCRDVVDDGGYFMHKYLPDKSLGSSWHPWLYEGHFQLPIQEDETALVLYALGEHYDRSRDLEFLEEMFNPLVEKTADFMVHYRDAETRLPHPSYDLWEEKHGTSTFTSATVYGALIAAAHLSSILGKSEHETRYRDAAEEIRTAIVSQLWDEESGTFVKMINRKDGETMYDRTIDASSVYGVCAFGVLPPNDPKVVRAWETTVQRLSYGISTGGIARYEGDNYNRVESNAVGNPWVITTLWYAEYLIATAQKNEDFDRVRTIFSWVEKHAERSGTLGEQFHPHTGYSLNATPLTWSHAAYVSAVLKYLERLETLGICTACSVAL